MKSSREKEKIMNETERNWIGQCYVRIWSLNSTQILSVSHFKLNPFGFRLKPVYTCLSKWNLKSLFILLISSLKFNKMKNKDRWFASQTLSAGHSSPQSFLIIKLYTSIETIFNATWINSIHSLNSLDTFSTFLTSYRIPIGLPLFSSFLSVCTATWWNTFYQFSWLNLRITTNVLETVLSWNTKTGAPYSSKLWNF